MTRLAPVPQVPDAVLNTPINATAQVIATAFWITMCAVVVVMLILDYRKHRSWVPTFMILGCGLGLLIEPFWDYSFQVIHFIPGQWHTWTAFGIPQPLWIAACYLSGFAAYPLVLYRKVMRRDSAASFIPWVASTLIAYELVEIIMTGVGLYQYWGAHPLRIWNFPAYVSFGNWAGIIVTAVGAAAVDTYVRSPRARAIGAMLMFPLCFIGITFATQLPMLIVLNGQPTISALSYVAAIAAMVLGVVVAWLALRGLPFPFVLPNATNGVNAKTIASQQFLDISATNTTTAHSQADVHAK
jgi:hypothetical protein